MPQFPLIWEIKVSAFILGLEKHNFEAVIGVSTPNNSGEATYLIPLIIV